MALYEICESSEPSTVGDAAATDWYDDSVEGSLQAAVESLRERLAPDIRAGFTTVTGVFAPNVQPYLLVMIRTSQANIDALQHSIGHAVWEGFPVVIRRLSSPSVHGPRHGHGHRGFHGVHHHWRREAPSMIVVEEDADVSPPQVSGAPANIPLCVDLMKRLVVEKYRLMIAYTNFADQLRAFYRDAIASHFEQHSKEEREQAYQLAKRLTALGFDAPTDFAPIPPVPLDDPRQVFALLRDFENAGVALYEQLNDAAGGDVSILALAQNGGAQDQQHADDMTRYLLAR